MPREIEDVDVLQEYIRGVVDRAEHHAPGVDQIALAVAGAVVWRKQGRIRVMERDGNMKNVLWVDIGSARYALSYNHEAGAIEVREQSTQGRRLASFSNATPISEVKRFFSSL